MKITTAIFDLDGTLLNTIGDLCDSVNCAIVRRGFPAVDEELTRQRVGNGVRKLVERCIPEEKRTEAMIDACLDDPRYAAGRREVRAETWVHPGEGARRAADYLVGKLAELEEGEGK